MDTKPVFTEEAMRERFDFLSAHIEKVMNTSPRIERDEKFTDLTPKQHAEFDKRIAEHENGLFELRQEHSRLARMLGGRSMGAGSRK